MRPTYPRSGVVLILTAALATMAVTALAQEAVGPVPAPAPSAAPVPAPVPAPSAVVAPAPAPGATPKPAPGGKFAQLLQRADVDGNQQVTFEELSAAAPKMTRERFARLDKNGDGVLSRADRQAGKAAASPADAPATAPAAPAAKAGGGRVAELFRRADTNRDGKITLAEWTAVNPRMTPQRFARLDQDQDGAVSPKDLAASARQARVRLMALDANHDGKLTFEEVTAGRPKFTREAFDRMDRNKDGVLSAEDRAAK